MSSVALQEMDLAECYELSTSPKKLKKTPVVNEIVKEALEKNDVYEQYAKDIEILIFKAYAKATAVFSSKAKATKWINTPNIELDGETPRSLLGNIFGAQEVIDLLGRIQYGG